MNQDQNKDGEHRAQTDGRNKRKKKMVQGSFLMRRALFSFFRAGNCRVFYLKGRSGWFRHPGGSEDGGIRGMLAVRRGCFFR